MTKAFRTALIGFALAGVTAQAAPTPHVSLVSLQREDAGLRDRIARLQLDDLVARVDRVMPTQHKHAPTSSLDREVAAYAF